jgi:hypothetical protein
MSCKTLFNVFCPELIFCYRSISHDLCDGRRGVTSSCPYTKAGWLLANREWVMTAN